MAWLFLSNVCSILVGLGLIKVISKIGPVEFGKYALVLSIAPLVNSAIYIPIDQFCQRYYYTYLHENKGTFFLNGILAILRNIGLCVLSLCIAALAISRYVFSLSLESLHFLLISCFYIFVFTSGIPFLSLLNTMRLRSRVALFAVGEKLAQLMALIGICFFVNLDAQMVLLIFAGLGAFFLFWKIKMVKDRMLTDQESEQNCEKNNSRELICQLTSFGLPILVFGLLAWLQTYSERWVIQFTLDLSLVGIYTFMVMIVNTSLMVIFSSFGQFVGPITWEKFSDLRDLAKITVGLKFIRFQVWFVSFVTGFFVIVFFFIGDWVTKVLGGISFSANSRLLPLITLGIGLFFIGQTLNSIGFGLNRMPQYTLAKVLGAIGSVFFYWLGACWGGLVGVVWASVVANSIYVTLTLATNRRILKGVLSLIEKPFEGNREEEPFIPL